MKNNYQLIKVVSETTPYLRICQKGASFSIINNKFDYHVDCCDNFQKTFFFNGAQNENIYEFFKSNLKVLLSLSTKLNESLNSCLLTLSSITWSEFFNKKRNSNFNKELKDKLNYYFICLKYFDWNIDFLKQCLFNL